VNDRRHEQNSSCSQPRFHPVFSRMFSLLFSNIPQAINITEYCNIAAIANAFTSSATLITIMTNDWQAICPPSNFSHRDHRGDKKNHRCDHVRDHHCDQGVWGRCITDLQYITFANKYDAVMIPISVQYVNRNADSATTLKISCQWPDSKLPDNNHCQQRDLNISTDTVGPLNQC